MNFWKTAPILLAFAAFATGAAWAAKEHDWKPGDRIERMCSADRAESHKGEWMQRRADRLAERLKLSDAQKAAFKDFEDTRAKLREDRKTAICANRPDLTKLEGRINFQQTMLENRLADMKTTTPKLLAFYNTLSDYQKGEFDTMLAHRMRREHGGERGGE